MRTLTVIMPTVTERRILRIPTVCQLDACNLTPVIATQPDSWPIGKTSCRQWRAQVLATAEQYGNAWTLVVEDDVDLDPAITRILPQIMNSRPEGPVSLRHRLRFAPEKTGQLVAAPRKQNDWYGAQAILFSASQARELRHRIEAMSARDQRHFDALLRHMGILCTPRSFVEHRRLPRLASTGPYVAAHNYHGWDSHAICAQLWNWLPGRTDRRRVANATVASAALGLTETETRWALKALVEMGCALPYGSGNWHRCKPLPWLAQTTPAPEELLC